MANRSTWEPDFLVIYKGRAGIIEVDGRTHVKKWLSDGSRDCLFEDAGVAYVDHIDAADIGGPEVDQFLRRLGAGWKWFTTSPASIPAPVLGTASAETPGP